ncbi:MAG: hypothetical protein AAAB11_06330 [Rhizobium giardinii]
MKILLASIALVLFASSAHAGFVNGYTRSNGTYVQPHYRSAPNGSRYDNYSTSGNVNPYTGQAGTRRSYDTYGNDCTGFC